MKLIRSSFLFLFFLFFFSSSAQENDFQIWNSISIKKKITKKNSLYFKFGLRFRENSTLKSKDFLDIKYKKTISKLVSWSIGYRAVLDYDIYSEMTVKQRFYSDFYLSKKRKRYYFNLRNRLLTQGEHNNYKNLFRQRIQVSYNLRKTKLEPSISYEYFYGFSKKIDKTRINLSLSYPLNKNLDFGIGFKIQNEYYVVDPLTLYIFDSKLIYKL